LSPLLVAAVTECIQNFCVNSGITLLVVEQNYRMALKVAGRHYLMGTKGQIVGMATTAELEEDPKIIQDHLSV
jgi:branched-chain amino acid transport system ATP-binding protein